MNYEKILYNIGHYLFLHYYHPDRSRWNCFTITVPDDIYNFVLDNSKDEVAKAKSIGVNIPNEGNIFHTPFCDLIVYKKHIESVPINIDGITISLICDSIKSKEEKE